MFGSANFYTAKLKILRKSVGMEFAKIIRKWISGSFRRNSIGIIEFKNKVYLNMFNYFKK